VTSGIALILSMHARGAQFLHHANPSMTSPAVMSREGDLHPRLLKVLNMRGKLQHKLAELHTILDTCIVEEDERVRPPA
jgi:hypothetical protein